MEKIRKIDVGTLLGDDSHSVFEDDIRKRSYMNFENGGHFDDSSHIHDLNGKHCYIVSKDEMDAYMARKEQLEQMNCTPVFGENQRLKAKVNELEAEKANLREINKSLGEENSKLVEENEALVERNTKLKLRLDKFYGMTSAGEELRAANEKLAAEVAELNERISHLETIQRLLAKENTSLMCENGKLRGTCNELNAAVAKLRQELDKFNGEHTVEFLYEKHEDGKHIIGWTEVSGEEYELTFLTPERTIHE